MTAAEDRDGGRRIPWTAVQDVIGPLDGGVAADALYARGAVLGGPEATPSGRRARMTVAPGSTASFGTYFNAFPAAVWRHTTAAGRVRLALRLSGAALVAVRRSDASGAVVEERSVAVGADGVLQVDLLLGGPSGGFAWFAVTAPPEAAVEVLQGSWSVDAPPVRGDRAVLGMPTMDRAAFVAANLGRLASAPALLLRVLRIVVVDQGGSPAVDDPAIAAAADVLGDSLRLLRQGNLGGSGGYSRILDEASAEAGADVVVLLDDDIQIEPASLLRSLALGRCTTVPTIVGGQMLDLGEPTTLQAAAERIAPGVFWWGAADGRISNHDHAAVALSDAPWLHRRLDADYNGWWMCQLPIGLVQRVGLVLPLFLKWDDAEYGLRAAAAGVPTVSLPSAAVWHIAFRSKDDAVEWPAFFHARNRLVAAMLHRGSPTRVVGHSLALDLKQLLAKEYPASRLRHAGIREALAGPEALERTDALQVARRIAAAAPALRRLPSSTGAGARTVGQGGHPPSGAVLLVVGTALLLRQLIGGDRGPLVRAPRAEWWVLARHGRVAAPTADGAAMLLFVTDRRALLRGVAGAVALHLRLLVRWHGTARRYREAAPRLVSPEAWRRRFAAATGSAAEEVRRPSPLRR